LEKKDINLLTEEDKFLMQLTKVERLATKLSIMSYMGNFMDNLHLISPVSLLMTSNKSKLIYIVSILASSRYYISFEFCKEFQEITSITGDNISIW